MTCLTCSAAPQLAIGFRVTVSRMEQVMLRKDLSGTVVALGHPDTLRRNMAKVRWDCGHKDQWWPLNCLIAAPGTEGSTPN